MMERYQRRYGVSGTFGNRAMAPFVAEPAPFSKERESYGLVCWATPTHTRRSRSWSCGGACWPITWDCSGNLVFAARAMPSECAPELGSLISIISVGHVDEAEAAAVLRTVVFNTSTIPLA